MKKEFDLLNKAYVHLKETNSILESNQERQNGIENDLRDENIDMAGELERLTETIEALEKQLNEERAHKP